MHKFIGIILLISLCGLMSGSTVGAVAQVAQTTATGAISGRVTEMDGVTPIAGVTMRLITGASTIAATVTTDILGDYLFSDLTASYAYKVNASKVDYVPEFYDDALYESGARSIPVYEGQTILNINFALDLDSVITGKVTEADGVTPIAGAKIVARGTNVFAVVQTISAADGTYSITGLRPDHYQLLTRHPDYAKEYYANRSDIERAHVLAIGYNTLTENINFTLDPPATVTGRILASDGVTPIANARIMLYEDHGYAVYASDDTVSAADGSYTVHLATGSYCLNMLTDFYLPEWCGFYHNPASAPNPFSVTNGTVTTGMDYLLIKAASISGRVFAADGVTPIANARVEALQPNGAPTGKVIYPGFNPTQTASDGTYTIIDLYPGTYIVQAQTDSQPMEYYPEQRLVTAAQSLIVTEGSTTTDINFTLASEPSGSIAGRVTQSDGVTPAFATTDIEVLMPTGEILAILTAAEDGYYQVNNLPIGNYLVRAQHALSHAAEYYPEQAEADTAAWVPVTVNTTTNGINFTLDSEGGIITGKITNSDGMPLRGRFLLFNAQSNLAQSLLVNTNEQGEYQSPRLLPGSYTGVGDSPFHTLEYYPEQPLASAAQPIFVTEGSTTPNINFTLDFTSPLAAIHGSFQRIGMPPKPHSGWAQPLTVTIMADGIPFLSDIFMPDEQGVLLIPNLALDSYTVRVDTATTLPMIAHDVTLMAGDNLIDLGTLRGGDANGDHIINVSDFSILATTFSRTSDMIGFDTRADFNNDGVINITDFSILATYFGQSG